MTQQLIDIAVRRGRLIERIAGQRALLGQQLQPIRSALHTTDQGIAGVRAGVNFVRQRPGLVAAAVALLVILKPRRVLRWGQRGFVAWRTWRTIRRQLTVLGWHAR